ncbi:MAG: DNA polymerase III subunit beta [Bacteroidetes bacterium]|nr:DNA polymerase III subunit beta [Bacteroidota bacterium]
MKFSISADKFFNAVNKLNYVVPGSSHSTLPILSNIYFNLDGNSLNMVSTDLEAFIKTGIEVEGTENGAVAVPARKLLDLLKALIIKTESVSARASLSAEAYNLLVQENILPDLKEFDSNYDAKAGALSFKGRLPEESFMVLEEVLTEMKEKAGQREDLVNAYNAFSESLKLLKVEAAKAFKKSADKIKIKFESNDKHKITINSKNGKYQFFGEPVEDYPLPDDREELSKLEMEGIQLRRFLQKVKHSVKNDEIRRNMAGVFMDLRKSELRFVATDGFRLSKVITGDYTHENGKDDNFILPIKTVDLLPKLITDGKVKIEFDDVMIKFTFDGVIVYSKLIDDTFPNYESVIPKDNDKKLLINRYEILSALRRASIFTDKVTNRVKFEVTDNELTIKSDNPEIGGEGEETLDCDFKTNSGDEITETFAIAFNVSYLLDCLTQIETDDIMITFSSPSKASIILPVGSDSGEDYMELIMPVRVG